MVETPRRNTVLGRNWPRFIVDRAAGEVQDLLGLPRPKIAYNLSDYTKQGIAAAFLLKNVIFRKLGAEDFTKTLPGRPLRSRIELGWGCERAL
ncbi:hypothetical protein GGD61_008394 [Bradyrhizobium sp. SBR1B]|nr:hypothetical protein [Bradyrhizobium sp. SBR1B]